MYIHEVGQREPGNVQTVALCYVDFICTVSFEKVTFSLVRRHGEQSNSGLLHCI